MNARQAASAGGSASAKSRRAVRLVHEIVLRHFGERPRRIHEHGGGLTNSVYQFRVAGGEYILRTHADATKISDYLKEQWAMDAARGAGVPVPKVLEVANFADGRAYMISELVPGVAGLLAADRLAALEALGRAAAALQTVRTHGYGPVFDWSSNTLSRHESWADYLARGFDVEARLDLLLRHRVLDAARAARLRKVAAAMSRWRRPAVLHHGDLRLKNVILDGASGRLLALIDWETCTSSPGPYWDLSLALHDLGVDECEAFIAGYGMDARDFAAALPFVRLLNILNYAPTVGAAAAAKDKARLDWLRLRLQGGMELFGH